MASGNGGQQQGQQGASVMWQEARKFHGACAGYQPKGMMEVRAEAWEMPGTLAEIANGLYARAQANAKESLDPSLHALYVKIADMVQAAAGAARHLGPGFDAMHSQLIHNLTQGSNPAGWDSTNNQRTG